MAVLVSVVLHFSFCRPDSLALLLEIPSVARDSLTQREAQTFIREDTPPRLWEVESVAGTSWYSPRYLAVGRLTSSIDAVADIYFIIKYIFPASHASNNDLNYSGVETQTPN